MKNEKLQNITFEYYSGLGLKTYQKGIFYAKIFNKYGTYHVAFNGKISEIDHFNLLSSLHSNQLEFSKRNEILLIKNNDPINIDLDFLDKYYISMKLFNEPISNMKHILEFVGIDCTHVCQINRFPFNVKYFPIEEIDIISLYK